MHHNFLFCFFMLHPPAEVHDIRLNCSLANLIIITGLSSHVHLTFLKDQSCLFCLVTYCHPK
jgi:hypothetical protein